MRHEAFKFNYKAEDFFFFTNEFLFCVVRLSLGGGGGNFEEQASSAVLDLMGDDGERLNQHKALMKW